MMDLKHVGRLKNTGDRVIVVFRQLLDGNGKTIDEDHALVIYPDRLQDRYHDRIVDLLESDRAQQTENFYEVLHARAFHDGNNMLTFLHNGQYLKKVQVDNVVLCPNTHERIALRDYNEALEENNPQSANRLQDYADESNRKQRGRETIRENDQMHVKAEDIVSETTTPSATQDSDSTPEEQAKAILVQAHIMEQEHEALGREIQKKKEKAYSIDPTLKPSEKAE